ncbi:hypothetical protein QTP86_022912 [Hemibagrus guttatus]|nr:hypothetical protein QTP86_022912 [Hemibagrus guttatus]
MCKGKTQQWKTRLGVNGMQLNTKKTEYMECGPQIGGSITVDGEDLKKVTEFKYLGSVISSDGDLLPDVLALYGSECWPAAAKHEQALHVMEMCMLRWSLGLTRWVHVMNTDVRKIMGIGPITDKMQEARLR